MKLQTKMNLVVLFSIILLSSVFYLAILDHQHRINETNIKILNILNDSYLKVYNIKIN
jgi:preprotein translocase subunit YajC